MSQRNNGTLSGSDSDLASRPLESLSLDELAEIAGGYDAWQGLMLAVYDRCEKQMVAEQKSEGPANRSLSFREALFGKRAPTDRKAR
jgi:hypothetical protein